MRSSVASSSSWWTLRLVLTMALVGAALGYDFQDPHFNEAVRREMEEMMSEDQPDRHARSVHRAGSSRQEQLQHCSPRTQIACCGHTPIFNMADSVQKINKKCNQKYATTSSESDSSTDYFNCTKISQMKRRAICIKQCVGTELEIVDDVGNLRDARVREYMVHAASGDSWKRMLAEEVVDKCIEASTKSPPRTDGACNHAAMDFLYCTWAESQLNCPEMYRVAGERCDQIRRQLEKIARDERRVDTK